MKKYLFLLGRNPELSRQELKTRCEEVFFDPEKGLFIGKNLIFENPRNLPKTKEQLFQDRLGGTIRFGEIIAEDLAETEILNKIIDQFEEKEKIHLGISGWGISEAFIRKILEQVKKYGEKEKKRCRIENPNGKNIDSGRIFHERLLSHGAEFLIWKRGEKFLLARTLANQNLRNYTLRDRIKFFRDARMGMLPPKLAQILINLAQPEKDEILIDPFCGSGTINIESAIMGYKTVGSDREKKHSEGAQENFMQMAQKFRYDTSSGEFLTVSAEKFPFKKYPKGIIVTEGILGTPFLREAKEEEISKESRQVLDIWKNIFTALDNSKIYKIVCCIPIWKTKQKTRSISKKMFTIAEKYNFFPQSLGTEKTLIYAREDAYVGREICVLKKKDGQKTSSA